MELFLNDKVALWPRDCLEVLAGFEAESFDSCVTDPPYHLQSIHKRFAAKGRDETSERYAAGAYGRHAKGFMGKQWDGGDVAFRPELWTQVLRVLKPGGHLIAFGGTRTYHRMACAIEDAGFEVRDAVMWHYNTGFPKSHDLAKGIDRTLGAEGTYGEPKSAAHAGWIERGRMRGEDGHEGYQRPWMEDGEAVDRNARRYIPGSPEAVQWQGWGSALKPATEILTLARRSLIGSIAENVLAHGTGALNIDACRIEASGRPLRIIDPKASANGAVYAGRQEAGTGFDGGSKAIGSTDLGRWPANLLHDGSEEVVAAMPNTDPASAGKPRTGQNGDGWGMTATGAEYEDSGGSAARFFFTAKADANDRLGSKHPTVKPLDLMQWLVRLVTPPGGLVLDPFAGTGTTGEAAWREGCKAVLIEREPEYQADIRRRMAYALAGPDERRAAGVKAAGKIEDAGPLFTSR